MNTHVDSRFRIIHGAMVGGVVLIVILFTALRQVVTLTDDFAGLVLIFRVIAALELGFAVVVAQVMKTRIARLDPGGDRDAWWMSHAGRVLVVWAMIEGSAVLGAVFWFLTGDGVILAGVSAVALALLMMNRPTRLQAG